MRIAFRLAALALAALGLGALGDTPPGAPPRIAFQIGTGSTAGTYFPIGQMLAAIISHPPGVARCESDGRCGPVGLFAAARASAGSVENVRDVNGGRIASGLAQADIVADAYNGVGAFKDAPLGNLRTIAWLFPETIHIVVRRDSGIAAIADLKSKRVSIDSEGSGTHLLARAVLTAFKLPDRRLKLSFENAERSLELMMAGELDAFFFVGGAPLGVLEEYAKAGQVTLLPFAEGPEIEALLKARPYLQRAAIPAGTYEGIADTPTLSTGAIWIVGAQVPDDLVYAVVRALWNPDNRSLLDSGHPKGRQIRLDSALWGSPVPLHPGAERFYREIGMLPQPGPQASP